MASRIQVVSMALLFVAGASLVTAFSTLNSLVQENAPADLKGRVLSIWGLAFRSGTPLGAPLAGAMVRALGAPARPRRLLRPSRAARPRQPGLEPRASGTCEAGLDGRP